MTQAHFYLLRRGFYSWEKNHLKIDNLKNEKNSSQIFVIQTESRIHDGKRNAHKSG